MKKLIHILVTVMVMISCLVSGNGMAEEKELHIVATIFPICDWVRAIAGTDTARVTVTQLLDSGVDLHSYQPTAEDILKVSESDLFIFVGGESDEWVENTARVITNPEWKAFSLLEALGDAVKAEEIVEGMEHEQDGDEHDHEEEEEADEHVWLSLRNAQILTRAIAEAMGEIDPAHADGYRKNAEIYGEKLKALDEAYQETVDQASVKTLLFGDRFPFRYLADDYGLSYFAAFSGCSAECEASFQTVIFLAQKLKELNLPAVLTIENSRTGIAQTVVENARAGEKKILTLNSMQGTTSRDAETGVTYLSIMESNLEVLKEALN